MKTWLFTNATICLLFVTGIAGCGQKQDAAAPASQNTQASSDQASPDAPRIDPSKSPTADPASPLYGWEKYSSAEGIFSAIFPTHPKEDDKTIDGKAAQVQMHLFVAESDAQSGYGAGYYDISRMDDPKMVLARIEQAMVKNHNGKITSYKPIQVDGHAGTQFEFVFGDKPDYSSSVKLISVGQRVYLVMAVFHTSHPNADEREAFFNSFAMQ